MTVRRIKVVQIDTLLDLLKAYARIMDRAEADDKLSKLQKGQ